MGTEIIVDQLSFDFSSSTDIKEFSDQEMASLGQNIPNPAVTSTSFPLQLNKGSTISLHLYDCLGNEVKSDSFGLLNAGNHNIVVSVNDLPSGIYQCCIMGDGFMLTKKIIVM